MNAFSLSRGAIALLAGLVSVARINAAARGTVVVWGENVFGQANMPAGLTDVVAIAAGGYHVVALKDDGTVVAWGANPLGQSTVPAGLTGVKAIAAENSFSAALKNDGTVVAWGDNSSGQLNVPAGLSGITAIAAGTLGGTTPTDPGGHMLALKSDGTVVAWGDNSRGQLNVPPGLSGVTAIAASFLHSVALLRNGTVVAWGNNNAGQSNVPALSGVVAIAARSSHDLALLSDGTVVGWGLNRNGQIDIPPGLTGVTAIAAGSMHSMALTSDGRVVAWGLNDFGQANVPAALSRVIAISGGGRFSAALVVPLSPPTVTMQPQTITVNPSASAAFNVAATGTEPLSYQWRKDGVNIAGATGAMLVIQNTTAAQTGSYSVVASNSVGSATSNAATLTVSTNTTDPGRLINLSILTPLAANETMTMGTVLGGAGTSGSKPLLARAAGPSLAQLGVTGFLPDPTMTLVNTSAGSTVATNNDWGGGALLTNAFATVGAFGYVNATSKDAAIFQPSLARGNYTVQVSDVGNGSGTVIAELYDSSGAINMPDTPRLINVSVLKQISTGGSLTAGFVVGGSTAMTVLIRAVGPTLGVAPFGLGGVMLDPQLKLSNAAGVVIATNDDWGGDAQLASAASRVGAFALSAPSSKDAVLLLTLAPGNYTAQMSPANGTAGGITIVEIYEVP